VKVTTETLERCETLLTVEIEPRQEQKILQQAAKRIAREVRIPGFRPGKAPYNVIVRRFGLDVVQQEAMEHAADKLIQDALTEADLTPYAQINLDNIEWEPLTIKLKVPTEPQVEIGDYRDVRVDFEPIEVTDEDVQTRLESIQQENAPWAPVERAAEIGDLIDIRVVEKDGDEVINERESQQIELEDPAEHEGHGHPDMNTPLLGLSADEEKTFTLTYAEDYNNPTYAGKEITFEVKVNAVKEKEPDPIDDEFAQSFSDFDTLEEFRADLHRHLLEQRQNQQNAEIGNEAIEKIMETSTVEWPEAFEDEQVEREIKQFEQEVSRLGLNMESYYQLQNTSPEDFAAETRERVSSQIKRGLILSRIIELEKLSVSDSEILERAKMMADMYGASDEIWRAILASEAQQRMLAEDILSGKAMERLAAIAKGENPPIEADEADETVEADTDGDEAPAGDETIAEVDSDAASDEPENSDEDEAAADDEPEVAEAEAETAASETVSEEK
jgi:trigger factor